MSATVWDVNNTKVGTVIDNGDVLNEYGTKIGHVSRVSRIVNDQTDTIVGEVYADGTLVARYNAIDSMMFGKITWLHDSIELLSAGEVLDANSRRVGRVEWDGQAPTLAGAGALLLLLKPPRTIVADVGRHITLLEYTGPVHPMHRDNPKKFPAVEATIEFDRVMLRMKVPIIFGKQPTDILGGTQRRDFVTAQYNLTPEEISAFIDVWQPIPNKPVIATFCVHTYGTFSLDSYH